MEAYTPTPIWRGPTCPVGDRSYLGRTSRRFGVLERLSGTRRRSSDAHNGGQPSTTHTGRIYQDLTQARHGGRLNVYWLGLGLGIAHLPS